MMGLTEYFLKQPAPIKLLGCEPYNYPKYARCWHQRTRTIADGLILESPHPTVQQRIASLGITMALISEEDIQSAMRELFHEHALVVEPSSAVPLALVIAGHQELVEPICVVLTGGNIAREDFARLISPVPT